MVIGAFYRGPFDGKRIILPTPEPWPRFVIPQFGTIDLEWFYLLAGQLDETMWAYLFDDDWSALRDA